jgi:hypothetical protein
VSSHVVSCLPRADMHRSAERSQDEASAGRAYKDNSPSSENFITSVCVWQPCGIFLVVSEFSNVIETQPAKQNVGMAAIFIYSIDKICFTRLVDMLMISPFQFNALICIPMLVAARSKARVLGIADYNPFPMLCLACPFFFYLLIK